MITLHPHTPDEYQALFYQQIGLRPAQGQGRSLNLAEHVWENPDIGYIHTLGSISRIQTGVGNYIMPEDFATSYDYDFGYLHFGVVDKGFTYEVVAPDETRSGSVPSAFVSMEASPVNAIVWKAGLRFKGAETSISASHLREMVLPALGLEADELAWLQPNVRYTHLPNELRDIAARMGKLLEDGRLTLPLQTALALEFVALLARPDVARQVTSGQSAASERISLGDRSILITAEDLERVAQAHTILAERACEFPSIATLAREVGLSEQKLKVGFGRLYQQTVGDFAHTIRMGRATSLLRETDMLVRDVASTVGYQSQAAFVTMFRKWSGMTPRVFRAQARELGGK